MYKMLIPYTKKKNVLPIFVHLNSGEFFSKSAVGR